MTLTLTPQLAADLMTTALEGGSGYWIASVTPRYRTCDDYAAPSAFGPNMIVRKFRADDEDESIDLTWDKMCAALQIMHENYPNHYADILNDNVDADTADVFLQVALFNEVVFA